MHGGGQAGWGGEGLELETAGVMAPGFGEGPCTVGARAELGGSGFRARVTVGGVPVEPRGGPAQRAGGD